MSRSAGIFYSFTESRFAQKEKGKHHDTRHASSHPYPAFAGACPVSGYRQLAGGKRGAAGAAASVGAGPQRSGRLDQLRPVRLYRRHADLCPDRPGRPDVAPIAVFHLRPPRRRHLHADRQRRDGFRYPPRPAFLYRHDAGRHLSGGHEAGRQLVSPRAGAGAGLSDRGTGAGDRLLTSDRRSDRSPVALGHECSRWRLPVGSCAGTGCSSRRPGTVPGRPSALARPAARAASRPAEAGCRGLLRPHVGALCGLGAGTDLARRLEPSSRGVDQCQPLDLQHHRRGHPGVRSGWAAVGPLRQYSGGTRAAGPVRSLLCTLSADDDHAPLAGLALLAAMGVRRGR